MEWIDDVLENIDKYSLDTQYIAVMGDRDAKEYTKALQDKLSVKDMVNGFLDLAVSNVWIKESVIKSNPLYDSVEYKEWVKPTDFKWNEKPLCDLTEEELTELVNRADLHFYDWTCNSLEINNGKAKVVPYFLNENAYSYILEDIDEGRLSESKMKEVVNQWKQEQLCIYEKDGVYTVGGIDNTEFSDCTLENLFVNYAIPEETDMCKWAINHGYKVAFYDFTNNREGLTYEDYLSHFENYNSDKSLIVPQVLFDSEKEAKRFIEWVVNYNSDNKKEQEQKAENNNEVYLRGYFYLPTNSNNLEEALKVLEEIGFNMDNADAIELRDNEGNTIETMFDNILADIERD